MGPAVGPGGAVPRLEILREQGRARAAAGGEIGVGGDVEPVARRAGRVQPVGIEPVRPHVGGGLDDRRRQFRNRLLDRDGNRLLVGAVHVGRDEDHGVDARGRSVQPLERPVPVRRGERRAGGQIARRQRHRVVVRRRGRHGELKGIALGDGLVADGVQHRRRPGGRRGVRRRRIRAVGRRVVGLCAIVVGRVLGQPRHNAGRRVAHVAVFVARHVARKRGGRAGKQHVVDVATVGRAGGHVPPHLIGAGQIHDDVGLVIRVVDGSSRAAFLDGGPGGPVDPVRGGLDQHGPAAGIGRGPNIEAQRGGIGAGRSADPVRRGVHADAFASGQPIRGIDDPAVVGPAVDPARAPRIEILVEQGHGRSAPGGEGGVGADVEPVAGGAGGGQPVGVELASLHVRSRLDDGRGQFFADDDGDGFLVGAVLVGGGEGHGVDARRRSGGPQERAVLVRGVERRSRRQVAGRQRHRIAVRGRCRDLELERAAEQDELVADGVEDGRGRQRRAGAFVRMGTQADDRIHGIAVPLGRRIEGVGRDEIALRNGEFPAQGVVEGRGQAGSPFGPGIDADLPDAVQHGAVGAAHPQDDGVVAVEIHGSVGLVRHGQDRRGRGGIGQHERVLGGDRPGEIDRALRRVGPVGIDLHHVLAGGKIDGRRMGVVDFQRLVEGTALDVFGEQHGAIVDDLEHHGPGHLDAGGMVHEDHDVRVRTGGQRRRDGVERGRDDDGTARVQRAVGRPEVQPSGRVRRAPLQGRRALVGRDVEELRGREGPADLAGSGLRAGGRHVQVVGHHGQGQVHRGGLVDEVAAEGDARQVGGGRVGHGGRVEGHVHAGGATGRNGHRLGRNRRPRHGSGSRHRDVHFGSALEGADQRRIARRHVGDAQFAAAGRVVEGGEIQHVGALVEVHALRVVRVEADGPDDGAGPRGLVDPDQIVVGHLQAVHFAGAVDGDGDDERRVGDRADRRRRAGRRIDFVERRRRPVGRGGVQGSVRIRRKSHPTLSGSRSRGADDRLGGRGDVEGHQLLGVVIQGVERRKIAVEEIRAGDQVGAAAADDGEGSRRVGIERDQLGIVHVDAVAQRAGRGLHRRFGGRGRRLFRRPVGGRRGGPTREIAGAGRNRNGRAGGGPRIGAELDVQIERPGIGQAQGIGRALPPIQGFFDAGGADGQDGTGQDEILRRVEQIGDCDAGYRAGGIVGRHCGHRPLPDQQVQAVGSVGVRGRVQLDGSVGGDDGRPGERRAGMGSGHAAGQGAGGGAASDVHVGPRLVVVVVPDRDHVDVGTGRDGGVGHVERERLAGRERGGKRRQGRQGEGGRAVRARLRRVERRGNRLQGRQRFATRQALRPTLGQRPRIVVAGLAAESDDFGARCAHADVVEVGRGRQGRQVVGGQGNRPRRSARVAAFPGQGAVDVETELAADGADQQLVGIGGAGLDRRAEGPALQRRETGFILPPHGIVVRGDQEQIALPGSVEIQIVRGPEPQSRGRARVAGAADVHLRGKIGPRLAAGINRGHELLVRGLRPVFAADRDPVGFHVRLPIPRGAGEILGVVAEEHVRHDQVPAARRVRVQHRDVLRPRRFRRDRTERNRPVGGRIDGIGNVQFAGDFDHGDRDRPRAGSVRDEIGKHHDVGVDAGRRQKVVGQADRHGLGGQRRQIAVAGRHVQPRRRPQRSPRELLRGRIRQRVFRIVRGEGPALQAAGGDAAGRLDLEGFPHRQGNRPDRFRAVEFVLERDRAGILSRQQAGGGRGNAHGHDRFRTGIQPAGGRQRFEPRRGNRGVPTQRFILRRAGKPIAPLGSERSGIIADGFQIRRRPDGQQAGIRILGAEEAHVVHLPPPLVVRVVVMEPQHGVARAGRAGQIQFDGPGPAQIRGGGPEVAPWAGGAVETEVHGRHFGPAVRVEVGLEPAEHEIVAREVQRGRAQLGIHVHRALVIAVHDGERARAAGQVAMPAGIVEAPSRAVGRVVDHGPTRRQARIEAFAGNGFVIGRHRERHGPGFDPPFGHVGKRHDVGVGTRSQKSGFHVERQGDRDGFPGGQQTAAGRDLQPGGRPLRGPCQIRQRRIRKHVGLSGRRKRAALHAGGAQPGPGRDPQRNGRQSEIDGIGFVQQHLHFDHGARVESVRRRRHEVRAGGQIEDEAAARAGGRRVALGGEHPGAGKARPGQRVADRADDRSDFGAAQPEAADAGLPIRAAGDGQILVDVPERHAVGGIHGEHAVVAPARGGVGLRSRPGP